VTARALDTRVSNWVPTSSWQVVAFAAMQAAELMTSHAAATTSLLGFARS